MAMPITRPPAQGRNIRPKNCSDSKSSGWLCRTQLVKTQFMIALKSRITRPVASPVSSARKDNCGSAVVFASCRRKKSKDAVFGVRAISVLPILGNRELAWVLATAQPSSVFGNAPVCDSRCSSEYR